MDIQAVINSRYSIGLALSIGRAMPLGLGYRMANAITGMLARQKRLRMVQAVRANQWVVSGCSLSQPALDRAVLRTYQHVGRCLFDFYHSVGSSAAAQKLVQVDPQFDEQVKRQASQGVGLFLVTLHMSNFDLVGRVLGLRGVKIQILSVPDPTGGYRKQNRLRDEVGLELTPISMTSLRQAAERLKAGGLVLTGIDRPMPDAKYKVTFFGRPAALPVAYVRLALKARVPVTLIAAFTQPDGSYRLRVAEPVMMKSFPDLDKEVTYNAEALLRIAEDWIRGNPEQWAMFYPVWPEAIEELRGTP